MIYHKFSHRAGLYTLNGIHVNVMLESFITYEQKVGLPMNTMMPFIHILRNGNFLPFTHTFANSGFKN